MLKRKKLELKRKNRYLKRKKRELKRKKRKLKRKKRELKRKKLEQKREKRKLKRKKKHTKQNKKTLGKKKCKNDDLKRKRKYPIVQLANNYSVIITYLATTLTQIVLLASPLSQNCLCTSLATNTKQKNDKTAISTLNYLLIYIYLPIKLYSNQILSLIHI